MSVVHLTAPKGRVFVRHAIARALVQTYDATALQVAESRFGARAQTTSIVRAAIGGHESGGVTTADGAAFEFFDVWRAAAILGQMAGSRRVPFLTPLIRQTTRAHAEWVRERGQIRVRKQSFQRQALERLKLASMTVASVESIEDPLCEETLQADMIRSGAEDLDRSFVAVNNSGVPGETPASITSTATPIVSTGDPVEDVRALVENFQGDLTRAFVISDPVTFVGMHLYRDGSGVAPFLDLGARGGVCAGIPAIASTGSPRDSSGGQIALVDASAIAWAADDINIDVSQNASIVMSDDPESSGESDEFVSMFQEHAVAIRLVLCANWSLERAGAVSVVTGASYEVGS